MLAELGDDTSAKFWLCDFPPVDMQDIKAMAVEQMFPDCATTEQLFSVLPRATPLQQGALLRPVPGHPDGIFSINLGLLEGMPMFDWSLWYQVARDARAEGKVPGHLPLPVIPPNPLMQRRDAFTGDVFRAIVNGVPPPPVPAGLDAELHAAAQATSPPAAAPAPLPATTVLAAGGGEYDPWEEC